MADSDEKFVVPKPASFHILVVDDDETVCKSISDLVRQDGYRVTSVYRPGEALKLILETSVDIVLTDLMMPEINGWQLLQTVKKQNPEIPVIVFTGYVPEQGEALLTSRDADGYLIKPIEHRRMQVMLRALLFSHNLGRPAEVVLVDDDSGTLKAVEAALSARGIFVVPFSDPDEARLYIHKTPPDLVLTDIVMPVLDGFGLCKSIRMDPDIAYLPIIILTGYSDRENVLKAISLSVNGFISKPFSTKSLAEKILQVLRQSGKRVN